MQFVLRRNNHFLAIDKKCDTISVLHFFMSENKDYTSQNQTPIAANDAVFSVTTRDEALRILKKTSKPSIFGLVTQPIQNAVAGWLNIEF